MYGVFEITEACEPYLVPSLAVLCICSAPGVVEPPVQKVLLFLATLQNPVTAITTQCRVVSLTSDEEDIVPGTELHPRLADPVADFMGLSAILMLLKEAGRDPVIHAVSYKFKTLTVLEVLGKEDITESLNSASVARAVDPAWALVRDAAKVAPRLRQRRHGQASAGPGFAKAKKHGLGDDAAINADDDDNTSGSESPTAVPAIAAPIGEALHALGGELEETA